MTRNESEYRDWQHSRMLVVLGSFIVFGIGIAVGAVYGPVARVFLWVVGAVTILVLARRTRLAVVIDGDGVRAGRAHLEWPYIDRVECLDADRMRRALTTDAHPSDYIRVRGTTRGIRVWIDDDADPHRAWLLSVADSAAALRALHTHAGDRISHAA